MARAEEEEKKKKAGRTTDETETTERESSALAKFSVSEFESKFFVYKVQEDECARAPDVRVPSARTNRFNGQNVRAASSSITSDDGRRASEMMEFDYYY